MSWASLDKAVGVASVGCSVLAYEYFNCDMQQAAHGRAPAVATGIKRVHPNNIVFTYQGDGDLASIGMAEIVHAAARGEKDNRHICQQRYLRHDRRANGAHNPGGAKTTTSPYGRQAEHCSYPVRISELLATLQGAAYVTRVSVHDVPHIRKAKRAILKALKFSKRDWAFP